MVRVVPPSITTSQLNKLGERLRKSEVPTSEDLELLQAFREEFNGAMQDAYTRLKAVAGLDPSTRLKTHNSLIEKMKRDRTALSRMQDIGGLRIVKSMDLNEQDGLVGTIMGAFTDSLLHDQRKLPNHGYRAAHVHVELDGFRLEIQVRTELQDVWAQTNEKLGDLFGRAPFRYGAELVDPGLRSIRDLMARLSSDIAQHEVALTAEKRRAAELLGAFPGNSQISLQIRELNDLFRQKRDILVDLLSHAPELARARKAKESTEEAQK